MKRLRLSDSSLNSYGSRLITQGGDISQYEKNPVLLYMHQRGTVIGYIKDIRIEGDEITGEPVFDEATELSKQIKTQFEKGSIRMCSVGADILELSDDPALLLPGQTCPTITKWRLFEVSMVDIGANDNAIVLKKDGKVLELGMGAESPLPKLENFNHKIEKEMEIKTLALALGLEATATEEQVTDSIKGLVKFKKENATKIESLQNELKELKEEKETLTLGRITKIVEDAISEKKINAGKKDHYIELGKKIGDTELQEIFSAMTGAQKLTAQLQLSNDDEGKNSPYKKLSDVPAEKLLQLKKDDYKTYAALYKAEYGMDLED